MVLKKLTLLKYLDTLNLHVQNLKKGGFKKNGTEDGLQSELLNGKTERSVINKSNFAYLGHIWEPYPK